jgi:hypothetical protein
MSSLKYLIPKVNTINIDVDTIENKPILTDNFCIIGCDSAIDYDDDDDETPIFGNVYPLAYSYDGVTFKYVNDRTLYTINKVDFNGYQWIAGGYNVDNTRSLILSSDGINWVLPVNNVLSSSVIDVVWGQKKWVAIGRASGQNRFAYSSDGMNWTLSPYTSTSFACIAYNGSYFLAGGYNVIAKSSDGITWNDVNVESSLGFVLSLAWNGRLWVAGGSNAYPIAYSTDGESWTVATSATALTSSGRVVVYNGTKFLSGGTGIYELISSVDGINWVGVMLSTNETYLPGTISDITWNGIYWFVSNQTNNKTDPKIAYSSDLVNWTKCDSANTLFNSIQDVNTITSRNRKNYISTFI